MGGPLRSIVERQPESYTRMDVLGRLRTYHVVTEVLECGHNGEEFIARGASSIVKARRCTACDGAK